MPNDIIEMFWGCTVCKGESLGRYKTCQSCGKPRTEDSPEWMPGDISPMAAVRDEKLLEKAKAGPDWKCKYCSSSQFRADGCCAQCGSAQDDSTKSYSPSERPKEGFQRSSEADAKYLREGKPVALSVTMPIEVDKSRARKVPAWLILSLLGLGVVGILLYFALRTHEVVATVSSVSWARTVRVDRYSVYRHDGWIPDVNGVDIRPEGVRIHHYDHVHTGSHSEHYTVRVADGQTCRTIKGRCSTTPRNCKSNKNGFASCSGGDRICESDTQSCTTTYREDPRTRTVEDYEDVPRYMPYFSWGMWEWHFNRNVEERGTRIDDVTWPSAEKVGLARGLPPGEDERVADRTEAYKTTYRAGEETFDCPLDTLEAFQRAPVGSSKKLRVRGIGTIADGCL